MEEIINKCIGCKGVPNEKDLLLYENNHVKIVLHLNQLWLGRCVIAPIKHVAPLDLYENDQKELFLEIGKAIAMMTRVYKKLFSFSYPNICQLGNLTQDHNGKVTADMKYHHVHIHYIPRYENEVTAYGITFKDDQWGLALNIDNIEKITLAQDQLNLLVNDIRNEISKDQQWVGY